MQDLEVLSSFSGERYCYGVVYSVSVGLLALDLTISHDYDTCVKRARPSEFIYTLDKTYFFFLLFTLYALQIYVTCDSKDKTLYSNIHHSDLLK